MKRLWKFCQDQNRKKETTIHLFLFLNTILWCGIGALAWLLVGHFVCRDLLSLILFAGYAGVFPGWIGGAIFAMNAESSLA